MIACGKRAVALRSLGRAQCAQAALGRLRPVAVEQPQVGDAANFVEGQSFAGPGTFDVQLVGGPLILPADQPLELRFSLSRSNTDVGVVAAYQFTVDGAPVGPLFSVQNEGPDTVSGVFALPPGGQQTGNPARAIGVRVVVNAGTESVIGGVGLAVNPNAFAQTFCASITPTAIPDTVSAVELTKIFAANVSSTSILAQFSVTRANTLPSGSGNYFIEFLVGPPPPGFVGPVPSTFQYIATGLPNTFAGVAFIALPYPTSITIRLLGTAMSGTELVGSGTMCVRGSARVFNEVASPPGP